MARFLRKRDESINKPPGSLIYLGSDGAPSSGDDVKIHLFDYNESQLNEMLIPDLSASQEQLQNEETIVWIDVEGLSDIDVVKEIGKVFEIDPLYLEDVLNTDHRPKAEDLSKYLFIIIKSVHFDPQLVRRVRFEQLSLFLGDKFVISFHEKKSPIFEPIKARLRKAKGKIRSMEAAYLFYALTDVIVDNYFQVVERLGAEIEELDLKLVHSYSQNDLEDLNRLKSEILFLRKSIWPLRETLSQILRSDREDISEKTRVYLRDTFDHVVQLTETVESYREMLSGLYEVARTVSNRELNETMKILTVFTSIFIPLTFLSSIYGMNFKYMPELTWHHGYLMFWGLIFGIAVLMFWFFKKRKWI
jgi:magnesium transporter